MAQDSISPVEGPAAARSPGGPAVMIVEPLPDQQWKLARMFTVQGYRVIGSASLHAARALLRRFPVDLMLLADESIDDEAGRKVAELAQAFPKMRFLIMSDGKPAARWADGMPDIKWIRRPARMQDLVDIDAAVA